MALLKYSSPGVYKSALASMLIVLSVFLIGHDKLASGADEVVTRLGETGNGGFIRFLGSEAVRIDESPQSLYQFGSGETTTNGNVEEGISQHGSGAVTIHEIFKRGIEHAGSGAITINGDVYGPIRHIGTGALVINGHRYP